MRFLNQHIDKIAHFLGGFFLTVIFNIYIGILSGILKEIYDRKSGKGTPEKCDTICTILGSLVAHYYILWRYY